MPNFVSYLKGAFLRPRRTFNSLSADPRRLTYGAGAFLFIGFLYTLTVIGLAVVQNRYGTPTALPPWVSIPAHQYYFWEIFFTLPVFLLGWILAGGLVQLLGKAFRGSGSFEDTLAIMGFALSVPLFLTWSVETVLTILFLYGVTTPQTIGVWRGWSIFMAVYQLLAGLWYAVLIPQAVSSAQKLGFWPSLLIGEFTLVVVLFNMMIFIR